jgi:hypothetical protein
MSVSFAGVGDKNVQGARRQAYFSQANPPKVNPTQASHLAVSSPTANLFEAPTVEEDYTPIAWPQAQTVNELLYEETQAARVQQRQYTHTRMDATVIEDVAKERGSDRLELAAIYGVGKRLNVEVLINGQRRVYRHGHKWPDTVPDDGQKGTNAYGLQAIKGPCITLNSPAGSRLVCLGMEG